MWYQKEFKELELKEFYEIVQLRLETFIVEQTRIYNDLDDVDYRSIHLFHQNREGRVDAYARIFATGLTIHFGQVAVAKDSRGQGLGKDMVEHIWTCVNRDFLDGPLKLRLKNRWSACMKN